MFLYRTKKRALVFGLAFLSNLVLLTAIGSAQTTGGGAVTAPGTGTATAIFGLSSGWVVPRATASVTFETGISYQVQFVLQVNTKYGTTAFPDWADIPGTAKTGSIYASGTTGNDIGSTKTINGAPSMAVRKNLPAKHGWAKYRVKAILKSTDTSQPSVGWSELHIHTQEKKLP